jgi:type IV pilus assembly protein PilY1
MKALKYIKRIVLFTVIAVGFTFGVGAVFAQTLPLMDDYNYLPPFLGVDAKPNILLMIDNSGSMDSCAYPTPELVGLAGCTTNYIQGTLQAKGSSTITVSKKIYNLNAGYQVVTQDGASTTLLVGQFVVLVGVRSTSHPVNKIVVMKASDYMSLSYDKARGYSGIFESNKCYAYSSLKFNSPLAKTGNPSVCISASSNPWDGNFLNWMTMRRIDIAKWVLTGGQCNTARANDGNTCKTFIGEGANGGGPYPIARIISLKGVSPFSYDAFILISSGKFYIYEMFPLSGSLGALKAIFQIRVDAGVGIKQTGVLQTIGDRARFGLMLFNYDTAGKIKVDVGAALITLIKEVELIHGTTWTPLAETLYQSARYFAQIAPSGSVTNFTVGTSTDPYRVDGQWIKCCKSFVLVFTDGSPTEDVTIPDTIKDYAHTVGGHDANPDHHEVCSDYYDGPSESCVSGPEGPNKINGAFTSHYLDDVAYWAHITDLRPDVARAKISGINEASTQNEGGNLAGRQNLNIYTFLAFEKKDGPNILKDTAKVGGFRDINGNNLPDLQSEWDAKNNLTQELVPDGIPDTYFSAEDADSMRANMLIALNDIVHGSGSGTAVSFLATSSTGEGAIYQSYFFPQSQDPVPVSWLGHLQGLFLDNKGNIREDTNKDGRLVFNEDKIVRTYYDDTAKKTRVTWCNTDKEGKSLGCDPIPNPDPSGMIHDGLDALSPIWEAGKLLANRNPDDRDIRTWIDGINGPNGVVADSEVISFEKGKASTLRPYLMAKDDTVSQDIIEFIRGKSVAGFRNRQTKADKDDTDLKTWKLGDILGSDPVSVGAPREAFDRKNGDKSYSKFFDKYKDRRHVVYVGANDGMLHAFNGGFFHAGDDENTEDNPSTTQIEGITEHGYFTTGKTVNNGDPLGKERWGFIPQELLPHLQWLTSVEYDKTKHIFFVDGSPRITDARIFSPDDTHPNGWGTILIASMRMGGGLLNVDLKGDGMDTSITGDARFRSAYFAFDVTDPEANFGSSGNKLLWVFKDADLGFTTSFPGIMRMKAGTETDPTPETWYAIFGSGPLSYRGERETAHAGNQFKSPSPREYGQVYVVNLIDGRLKHKKEMGTSATDRYSFMGDPVAVDFEKDYLVDAVYIGKTSGKKILVEKDVAGNNIYKWDWSGKMHRILTDIASTTTTGNDSPAKWTDSVLFDTQKPVLVQPSITRDKDGTPWVLFGTGRLFSSGPESDNVATSTQALYGIHEAGNGGCWDKNASRWKSKCITTVSNLLPVGNISIEKSDTQIGKCVGCPPAVDTVFKLADELRKSYGGWTLDLAPGERVLSKITLLAGVVAVPSYTPTIDVNDVCKVGGTSKLYGISYETGTALASRGNPEGAFSRLEDDGKTIKRTVDMGQGIASRVSIVGNEDNVIGSSQTDRGNIVSTAINTSSRHDGTKLFLEKTE